MRLPLRVRWGLWWWLWWRLLWRLWWRRRCWLRLRGCWLRLAGPPGQQAGDQHLKYLAHRRAEVEPHSRESWVRLVGRDHGWRRLGVRPERPGDQHGRACEPAAVALAQFGESSQQQPAQRADVGQRRPLVLGCHLRRDVALQHGRLRAEQVAQDRLW